MTAVRVGWVGCGWLLILAIAGCGPDSPDPTPAVDPAAPRASDAAPETAPSGGTGAPPRLPGEANVVGGTASNVEGLPRSPDGLAVAGEYSRMFFEGELEELRENFSPEMKNQWPLVRLEAVQNKTLLEFGKQLEILGEDSAVRDDYRGFVRWAKFERYDGIVEIKWILHEDDRVAGFYVQPASSVK